MDLPIQSYSVVLRGNFNPAIFHPSWFGAHGLLRPEEVEQAVKQPEMVVHSEASVFSAEWLQIAVTKDRFQAFTTQESHSELLRDLVMSIFGLLVHTPLNAMGLNRDFHFRLESNDVRNSLGYRLVPKQNWQNVLKSPGMMNVTVHGQRPDDLHGYIQVVVAPSVKVDNGVYIAINDHYELKTDSTKAATEKATDILSKSWSVSMERAKTIATTLVVGGG